MDRSLVRKYIWTQDDIKNSEQTNFVYVFVCGMSTGMCAHVGVRYTIMTMSVHVGLIKPEAGCLGEAS